MSVKVYQPTTTGGNPFANTSFADSFARADQPFMVGALWTVAPLQGSTVTGGSSMAGAINVAGNSLNCSILSSNGVNECMMYPTFLNWAVAATQPQYSQHTISADNSGGVNFAFNGPAVTMNVNASTGYFIQTNNNGVSNVTGKFIVRSFDGASSRILDSNGNAGFSFNLNDVLRIESYPNTPAAGSTTLKYYVNGVLQGSFVDSVGHYSLGVFGIMNYFISTGITQSYQNYKGGIL